MRNQDYIVAFCFTRQQNRLKHYSQDHIKTKQPRDAQKKEENYLY